MVFSDSRYNEAGIGRYRTQLREVASLGLLFGNAEAYPKRLQGNIAYLRVDRRPLGGVNAALPRSHEVWIWEVEKPAPVGSRYREISQPNRFHLCPVFFRQPDPQISPASSQNE